MIDEEGRESYNLQPIVVHPFSSFLLVSDLTREDAAQKHPMNAIVLLFLALMRSFLFLKFDLFLEGDLDITGTSSA